MLRAKLKIPDKAKLKLPEKAKSLFPDRLGSLVSGFQDVYENGGGSDSIFESGEELEILEPNGFDLDKESEYQEDEIIDREDEVKVKVRMEKEKAGPVSAKDAIAADEKRSNLEFELSQKEINLEKLQRMANSGLPDGGSVRATTWKLLLGYLPPSRNLWENELTENRLTYHKLKEEHLLSPTVRISKKKK